MERQVPDVFDVFALGQQGEGRRQGVKPDNLAAPWEARMWEQGAKWAQRRSPCERPRTYDKFYQKTPGNFQPADERDSAISVCSSEECEQQQVQVEQRKRRRPRRSQSERRVRNRTLTERDVKHLERHLSMKRTIRKKIMSDLQHAFVRRPDRDGIEIQSLDVRGALQPNVLDLLRDSDDSGLDSPTRRRQGRRGRREEWIGREKTPPPDYLEIQEEKGKQQLSWWRRLLNRLLTRGRGQAVKKGEKQQNRLEYL